MLSSVKKISFKFSFNSAEKRYSRAKIFLCALFGVLYYII